MASTLTTLGPDAAVEDVLAVIQRDGAVILADVLDRGRLDGLLAEVMPYVEATAPGRDDFAGQLTTRTGALVARSPACRELILHPTVLDVARRFPDDVDLARFDGSPFGTVRRVA